MFFSPQITLILKLRQYEEHATWSSQFLSANTTHLGVSSAAGTYHAPSWILSFSHAIAPVWNLSLYFIHILCLINLLILEILIKHYVSVRASLSLQVISPLQTILQFVIVFTHMTDSCPPSSLIFKIHNAGTKYLVWYCRC